MIVTVHRSFDSLRGRREEWNELLRSSASSCIFLTYEWAATWWEVYGKGKELFVLLAQREETLAGIAPFYLAPYTLSQPLSFHQLHFIGDEAVSSDLLDFILLRGREREILHHIFDYLLSAPSWDSLLLRDMNAQSPSIPVLEELADGSFLSMYTGRRNVCPFIPLPKSFDEFLDQPDTLFKSIVRKGAVRVFKNHDVRLDFVTKEDEIDPFLERFFEIHTERWEAAGLKGAFTSEKKREFYRKIAHVSNVAGWFKASYLMVDGWMAAAQFGFLYSDTFYDIQKGSSEKGRSLRAGNILQMELMRFLVGRAVEFNALRGGESYKYQWGAQDRFTFDVYLWRGGRGRIAALFHSILERAKSRLKRMKRSIEGKTPAQLAELCLDACIRPFYEYREYTVAILKFGDRAFRDEERDRHTSCRRMEPHDLALVEQAFGAREARGLLKKLETSRGFILTRGGRIAAYVLVCGERCSPEGGGSFPYSIQPKPSSVYIFDLKEAASMQGKGFSTKLMAFVLRQLADKGFEEAFIIYNDSAMSETAVKLGFETAGTIRYRRLLNFTSHNHRALDRVCVIEDKALR